MKKKVSGAKAGRGAAKGSPSKASDSSKSSKSPKSSKPPAKGKSVAKPASKAKPAPKPKAKTKAQPVKLNGAAKPKANPAKSKKNPAKAPIQADGKAPKKAVNNNSHGDNSHGAPAVTSLRKPVAPAPVLEALLDLGEPASEVPRSARPGEEEAGLDNVIASISKIFGGRDFLSDADLDAFLDSKIASGEIPPSAALDPLDEAQSLVYEAWNTEGPEKIHLARRALDLSENCADAYVILADEDAKSLPAALELYRKGVEAAKRSLDPSIFARSAGKFWDIMETRPYMRARLGLAECLWDLGKKAESIEHLRDLLRLNPNDNQGVRYILVQCLLESGADEELGELLGRYPGDSSPEFLYTKALWMFRREGPEGSADDLLARAIAANPHVPAFLLKRKKLAADSVDSSGPGTVGEAEAYAAGAMDAWNKTLGAADWLSGHAPG